MENAKKKNSNETFLVVFAAFPVLIQSVFLAWQGVTYAYQFSM